MLLVRSFHVLQLDSCYLATHCHVLTAAFLSLSVMRFGHDWDPDCMRMDETLYKIAEKCKNFAVFYVVDISQVRVL